MAQTVDQPTPEKRARPVSASADPPSPVQQAPASAPMSSPPAAEPIEAGDGQAGPWRSPKRSRSPVDRTTPNGSRKAARRTRVVLRKVGPLSVLKFSLIFYLCVMLIVYLALLIIYILLSAGGAVDSLAKILGYVFGSGDSTSGPTPVVIDGRAVFTWLFVAGLVFAVIWSVINVFVAFLYNLISDIVGGIEVTLAEKPRR
jgi:hypothetical protein